MKKILSILMAAAMLMTLCAFGISAADEPTMTVSTASAERGQTASVDVVVSGNPGMNAAVLKPVYDTAALELVSMEFNDIDFRGNVEYGVKAVWAASADNASNGEFLTMTFKVLDGAEGSTVVSVAYEEGDICNSNEEDVNFVVNAGSVIFDTEPTAEPEPDTTVPEPDDTTTAAPSTTAGTEPTNPTAPQTADAGIAVAAVALAAAACFVAVKKRK